MSFIVSIKFFRFVPTENRSGITWGMRQLGLKWNIDYLCAAFKHPVLLMEIAQGYWEESIRKSVWELMCGQMRWVGPHEICDRRSPTKALHISAEFKRPLSTKYYNLLAFTGLGIACCLTFGERLGMNLQDDTHVHYHHWGSQAMIESWVLCEWTHQLRAKTHEIKHERQTHTLFS